MNKVKTLKFNIITAVLPWIFLAIIGFIKIKFFINIYGSELNGYIQLISQIYGYISLVEMGFGSAVTFRLYKPLAEGNKKEVAKLFNGCIKIYKKIAIRMAVIGIITACILPFVLEYNTLSKVKIISVFLLFVADYYLKYIFDLPCRILLYADQKRYKANLIVNTSTLIIKVIELFLILTSINYIFVLSVIILLNSISYILLSYLTRKEYSYIKDVKEYDITAKEMSKDVMAHKISRIVFYGTDNIIISMTKGLGLAVASIYGSYNYIVAAVRNILDLFLQSPLEMLGNRFVKKDASRKENFSLYQEFLKATYFIGIIVSAVFFVSVDKLVVIWINNEYIVSRATMAVFAIYLWYECVGRTNLTMIEANGKYKETKKIEIICAITNIALSFILVRKYGILGVVGATVISMMFLRHPMQIKFIYSDLFKEKRLGYYISFGFYTILMVLCSFLNLYVIKTFGLYETSSFMNWIISTIVIALIDLIIAFIPMYIFDKSFKDAVKRFLNKKKKETI